MSTEVTTEMMDITIATFEARKFYGHTIDKFGGDTGNALPEMKYHTSWDWIVPVCKKIKSIKFNNMNMLMLSMGAMAEMNNGLVSLDLERTHKGAFQFLNWYNQQKQTNGNENI